MTTKAGTVLVVEDDSKIRDHIVQILEFEGFTTSGVDSVRAGLQHFSRTVPDVVVSDILMPESDGLDLVVALRARQESRLTPIIMLTAMSQREWQRRFMELGADDYITKPFTASELVGAVQTQFKRLAWRAADKGSVSARVVAYEFDGLMFDPVRRVVHFASGHEESLTVSESRLLLTFLDHPRQGLSREMIFESMGRRYAPLDRTVDVLITGLRRKIEDQDGKRARLVTIRSVGYMLDVPVKRVNLT